MPDTNAFYPNLSALDNLRVRCMEWGIPPAGVDGILKLVGLESTGKKHAGSFSMGMKRRLDFAISLLGDPELLILDEPTNGLDPMGVVEVRKLLLHLNRCRGKTILISSHNLEELHKLATRFAFMSRGCLLCELTATELENSCGKCLVLHVGEPERAFLELESRGVHAVRMDDGSLRIEDCQEESGAIVSLLTSAGVCVRKVFAEQKSLEDYYAGLIARGDQ